MEKDWNRRTPRRIFDDMEEMPSSETRKIQIKRIGGYLHRVVPITNASGKVLSYALKPLSVEFRPRDIFQVIVGSTILALPVAFTEEAWTLGQTLPLTNCLVVALLSIVFIGAFVYFNFYSGFIKGHLGEFIKRSLGTYGLSLLVVALILTTIQRCPWDSDSVLAIKRVILVGFPASMAATISDTLK